MAGIVSTTRVVVLGTLIAIALYDGWVCTGGNTDASVSQFIVNLVSVSPVAYGVLCVLIGHFSFAMPSFSEWKNRNKK